ncbi:hypothetical protein [Micromonospora sp. C95]|uniref:hypothetical protein n=1 Tax=Micromonospora sp. C95 TaxID=2824882 RepID=UPI001B375B76|nr:hypothetical protein [Micromonospora sp. C95]MBQ1025070.1 hypothetical protein [Micromonospora sp. C95]
MTAIYLLCRSPTDALSRAYVTLRGPIITGTRLRRVTIVGLRCLLFPMIHPFLVIEENST